MAGLGPIPWSSFDRWALRHGISDEHFDFFWQMLQALEAELAEFQAREESK